MDDQALENFGWNSFFEASFSDFEGKGYFVGRVMLEHRKAFRLLSQFGEIAAEASGKLHYSARGKIDLPAVGDWAVFQFNEEERKGVIHAVLPRKSKFSRKTAGVKTEEQIVAANIDKVFLVSSLNKAVNIRSIERYLTLAWDSGASPAIILNKKDLCENLEEELSRVEDIALGVPVTAVSALTGDAVSEVLSQLTPGQTGALLGPSGVGKSTLLNRLYGEVIQEVREVREIDSRGRHTTTHRELFRLPSGALIIDTPGMRELQLWEGGEGLEETFEEIHALAGSCRFRDCLHDNEPGCAVLAALEDGDLEEKRYLSFKKLQKELASLAARQDQRAMLDQKRKNKRLHKEIRRVINAKKRSE